LILAAAVLVVGSIAVVAMVELQPGRQVQVVSGPNASVGTAGAGSHSLVVVQVAGAVVRPGVYSLATGSRVGDAIQAAGGYSPDVDPRAAETTLNLAAKLTDAESIVVPRRGQTASASTGTGAGNATAQSGPLNLNTATSAQLDALPGIGPATAAKIIASREQLPFTSVSDLTSRKLVSATVLAKFRDQVTV
jgi:competence protein ComEA